MLVSVRPCVFVPEADHVAEFMNHNAKLITVLSDGDGLRAATSPPHVGATPAGGGDVQLRANDDSLPLVKISMKSQGIFVVDYITAVGQMSVHRLPISRQREAQAAQQEHTCWSDFHQAACEYYRTIYES
ncbi:hypothetical protein EYF80_046064 [Liparis tanakae]|uniref:Uncharacterized protein n=1 Tax=Liparis tanakae TaxID=230148 RepID=A0A4Z2FS57_9TELE|nr:hypothetical protein EYF80_046064 [Liparis tanakae]